MRQVRDWITIKEFQELARRSPAQVGRWVSGKHLPHGPGDPRNPWPVDEVPLVILGPRRRVLRVAGISPTYLAVEGRSEQLAKLLSMPPEGWPGSRSIPPLALPDLYPAMTTLASSALLNRGR